MKSIILLGAGLGVSLLLSFSRAMADSLVPDALLLAERAAVAPDSGRASENDTVRASSYQPDSSAEDTGLIDSLHQVHLFDTVHAPATDTLQARTDTGILPGTLPSLPRDTFPPRPPEKIREAPPPEVRPAWLYPGLTMEQHTLATQMLSCFYNFDWNGADKAGKKLQRLEKKKQLPPLSYVLLIGMRVLRLQHGQFESDRERADLQQEIKKLAARGLELADPDRCPDSCRAVDQFIVGGINGFVATLDIESSPASAAFSGFAALRHLQKALSRDSSLYDAYLGMGLFNCIMAKAPFFVRSALSIIGKNVSFSRGLGYLRTCAYKGCYADEIARLYLTEFLSPYWGNEAAEKQNIFNSLEQNYPQNPYFVFLDLDENLCFHKQTVFNFSYKNRLKRQISRFKPSEPSAKRYADLVKWQYLLIDPFPGSGIAPDTSLPLADFSYYPVFLQALREKYQLESNSTESKTDRSRQERYIKSLAASSARMLQGANTMPQSRKSFFLWHLRDGLKINDNGKE
jgi:hypothetical protein